MNLNVEETVLEEIALEGLEGITLQSLWVRLSVVTNFPLDLNDHHVHRYLWNGVILPNVANGELSCYELPKNRTTVTLYNRYDHLNLETGTCIEDPDSIPDDIYERVEPISANNVRGSCVYFKERKDVTETLLSSQPTYETVQNEYENKLVIVATQKRREEALRLPYVNPVDLQPFHYCILERVGRARYQGEVTIGKESVSYREKPKTLFYYRNKLIRHGLLKKQSHIIYDSKGALNRHGLLLLLPRFYMTRLTPMAIAARKVNELLLKQPNLEIDYSELREKINCKKKMFRHIFPSYLKNFKVYEVEMDIGDNKVMTRRIVKLVKPICDDDDSEDEFEDDDDNDENGDLNPKDGITKTGQIFHPGFILADRTMLTQALSVIESCKSPDGISMKDIGEKLRLPRLEVRSLTRTLTRLGEVTEFRVEDGRQKRTHYIPRNKSDQTLKQFDEERKNLSYNVKDTITFLRRANLILETVKELKIVDQLFRLKKVILTAEKDSPYLIDQKSIQKIVQKLANEGHVHSIKMMLEHNGLTKKIHIVCDPSIAPDSPLIREKIEQLRFRIFGCSSEKARGVMSQTFSGVYEDKGKDLKLQYVPSMGRKYGLQPKLKKCLVLYRYLFYLLCTKPEPGEDYDDWRQFVQRWPEGCHVEGTCTLGDIIPRLPLSIFVQIVFITYFVPGLEELLNDPIVKHHTLSMLPVEIRPYLFYKRKYIFNIVEVLTTLSYMELVSISYKEQHPKESVVITIKRHPKITEGNITKQYDLQSLEDFECFSIDLALHCQRTECENCTLDKRLFAHNQRNWTYTPRSADHNNKSKKRLKTIIQLPQIPKSKPSADIEAIKQSLKRKLLSADQESSNKRLKPVNVLKPDKKKKQVLKRISSKKSKKAIAVKRPKIVRAPHYDNIDLAALKLMKKSRVDWSREEDSFLLMCRVASILLDPTLPHFICVNRNVVRDELHKNYPDQSKDKTARACQRRLMYMLKKEKTRQNVHSWVVECKQDVDLMEFQRPDVPRTHQDVWNETYLKLLHALMKKFQSHKLTHNSTNGSIDLNLVEDLEKYDIIKTEYHFSSDIQNLHKDPQNIVDIHISVVLNILLSSLMMTQKNEKTPFVTTTLFRIYQRYPDALIRSVATRLQTNGIITKIKKKTDASALRSRGSTPYRISKHYMFLLKTRMCIDSLLLPISSMFTIKDSDLATDAAIATSLLASQNITFKVDVPQTFLVYKNSKGEKSKALRKLLTAAAEGSPLTIDAKNTSRYALHMLRQSLSMCAIDGRKTQENYYVNKCIVDYSTENRVILDVTKFKKMLEIQGRYITVDARKKGQEEAPLTELLSFIRAKKELGATYEQIVDFVGGFWPCDEMDGYIDASLVHRVGITVFRYVHNDFISPWLVYSVVYPYAEASSRPTSNAKQIKFIARIWKNVHGVVILKVLFSYLSAIFGHIYINPGVSEQELINTFRICLPPVQILELLEMLVAVDCVTITQFESDAVYSLFDNVESSKKIIRHCEATASAIVNLCRLKQLLQLDDVQ